MKLVKISGPSSKLDKIISVCCTLGDFHPENAGQYVSQSLGYVPVSEESPYLQTLQSIKELADSYGIDLESPGKVKKAIIDDRTSEYIERVGDKLRQLNDESKQLSEQLEECESAVEKYGHFSGLGIDLEELFGCEFISTRFGYLSRESYVKLTKAYGDNPYILFCPCSSDRDGYWGAYFAPKDRADEVDRIFAALQFERLQIPGAVGTADEVISKLKENIEIIKDSKSQLDKQISETWEQEGDKIKALYLKLSDLNTVFELRRYAVYHAKSCFFVGWIPASDEKKFRERIEKYPEFVVEIEAPSKDSKVMPPTKLKNFFAVRPFSFFVEMYGLPSYYDIDITAFVAITYTLLFGIMFGDLGQGLVLALGGLIFWKKTGSSLGKILVPCGMSSMFFGFIFGSVFGFEHALDPVYKTLGMNGKPLEVMDSINTVLLFAIGIGVVLVIIAMVINVITMIKKRRFGSALFTENGVTGIIVYIGGANLIYAFMAKEGIFPTKISVAMLLVGIVILFMKELLVPLLDEGKFKKPESMMDFFLQNLFECIEYVLSYFSNTLSFLRVGAFVIVHASMMMVVFTLAGDTSSVKGIIVVILGNILIIALEGLLSGIQGLRLELYEMFSRFFEGDGKPFHAVSLASKKLKK